MATEYFVHPNALCETKSVGRKTRIWAFAHVMQGARIGAECNICDHVFIENDVVLGDRVTVKCGVQIWDGITVEDDVFIGPNVTFTNDMYPRSKVHPERYLKTVVRQGASIGANATILPNLEIGAGSMVGAGAVVTRSVPPNAVTVGNPARIVGYEGTSGSEMSGERHVGRSKRVGVGGVEFLDLPLVKDMRGCLSVGETGKGLPFPPRRYFLVFDVPTREVRGEHAHYQCHQLLICVRGSCAVVVDDGDAREEIVLDRPTTGVYLPPLTWATQYKYSPDAMLMVLASDLYDPNDYIRDYQLFRQVVADRRSHTKAAA